MTSFLITPIIILLFGSALAMVLPMRKRLQFNLAVITSLLSVLSSLLIMSEVMERGMRVMSVGSWQQPFGISIVADRFSAVMVLVSNFLGMACILYSNLDIDPNRIRHGFYSLLLALLAGVNGVFLTGDIFNLYVWFELLLISSFCLLTLGSERKQIKGAIPYVFINLFASCLLLVSIGTLYGITGALNLAELSFQLNHIKISGLHFTIALLFLLSFGIKAAVFPLFFWLPASYHTPPVTVTAIFSGLLTKAAIYALIRVFTLFFLNYTEDLKYVLLVVATFTMVIGVLCAAGQVNFKKILSFHIISQIGYMVMGLAFFTPVSLAATTLFIIHNMVVKSNLFLISGVAHRITGSSELKSQGGLYRSHIILAFMFLASAFSLTGLPPLSGFWGKFLLATAGLRIGENLVIGISLLVSLLTLLSMTKIWIFSFWSPASHNGKSSAKELGWLHWPIYILCLFSLAPALFPGPVLEYFMETGKELMRPDLYIEAVRSMGGQK